MKRSLVLSIVLGFVLVGVLVGLNDAAQIGQNILNAGWGILAVIAFHLTQMLFSAAGWQAVTLADAVPSLARFVYLRWIREGVNALLPVAQIGGEFVAARLFNFRGMPLSQAGASVTVDLTMEMLSQVVFTLLGLGLLAIDPKDEELLHWLVVGTVVALGVVGGFIAAQRFGLFRLLERGLLRLSEKPGWHGLGGVVGLHEAIVALYASPRRLGLAMTHHFISWLLGGLEVMLALHVVGIEVDWREGLIIESLGQAVRSIGFAVPGSLGIQEGGYILVCGLLGIDAQSALALSLLKRLREIALGIPGLIAWHISEKRRPPAPINPVSSEGTP